MFLPEICWYTTPQLLNESVYKSGLRSKLQTLSTPFTKLMFWHTKKLKMSKKIEVQPNLTKQSSSYYLSVMMSVLWSSFSVFRLLNIYNFAYDINPGLRTLRGPAIYCCCCPNMWTRNGDAAFEVVPLSSYCETCQE